MMPTWVSFLIALLPEHFSARRCAQIQFLLLQVELLKKKLPGNRIILSPEDRDLLLKAGAEFNHDIHDVLGIVAVKTYQQWSRSEGRQGGQEGRVSSFA